MPRGNKEHEFLKEVGKQILLERGFDEDFIKFERSIFVEGKQYIVDVVAYKNREPKVVVECGSVTEQKIKELRKCVKEVIHLPYCHTVNFKIDKVQNYFESATFRRLDELQQKADLLEKKNDKLQTKAGFLVRRNELLLDMLKVICDYRGNVRFTELKESSAELKQQVFAIDKTLEEMEKNQRLNFEKLKEMSEDRWFIFRRKQYYGFSEDNSSEFKSTVMKEIKEKVNP